MKMTKFLANVIAAAAASSAAVATTSSSAAATTTAILTPTIQRRISSMKVFPISSGIGRHIILSRRLSSPSSSLCAFSLFPHRHAQPSLPASARYFSNDQRCMNSSISGPGNQLDRSGSIRSNQNTHRLFPHLPWTPITESIDIPPRQHHQHYHHRLRMTPSQHHGTEGFRDAIRGSQDYIKYRGGGGSRGRSPAGGGSSNDKIPLESDPSQQQQRQLPPTQNIPFPKLTPGRRRNYRPPHVIQQLKQSSQLVMNYDDDDDDESEEKKNAKDYCDDDVDETHCLENFRDGKESARYINVIQDKYNVGVIGREGGMWDGEDNRGDDDGGGGGGGDDDDAVNWSDRYRTSSATKSPFTIETKLGGIDNDSDDYSSGSMNFRDGKSRMAAAYKDDAFTIVGDSGTDVVGRTGGDGGVRGGTQPDDGDDEDDAKDDEDKNFRRRNSYYAELLEKVGGIDSGRGGDDREGKSIDSFLDLVTADADMGDDGNIVGALVNSAVRKPIEESDDEKDRDIIRRSVSSSSTSTTLLSIDPKSVDIIPLQKSKADVEDRATDDEERANLFKEWDDTASGGTSGGGGGGVGGPFVKMFRGSASYIANHRGTTVVCHIPGELLEWEGFPGLMDDIALTWLLGMKIVLVGGCRHQIDVRLDNEHQEDDAQVAAAKGDGNITNIDGEKDNEEKKPFGGEVMMSSIRVTDEDTLRVVKEEAGFVRFEIERRLAKSLRLHGGLVKGSESLVGNVVSGNFYSAQVWYTLYNFCCGSPRCISSSPTCCCYFAAFRSC